MSAEFIELGSLEDNQSLFALCYGFKDPTDADAYMASSEYRNRSAERVYEPFRNFATYVPRFDFRHPRLLTTSFFERGDDEGNEWKPLFREKQVPPANSYNTCALLSAPRVFYRYPSGRFESAREKVDNPENWRPCFVEWGATNSAKLRRGIQIGDVIVRLFTAKQARGVIYAHERVRGQDWLQCQALFIEIHIRDEELSKASLQVKFFRRKGGFTSLKKDLEGSWGALLERARRRFIQWC